MLTKKQEEWLNKLSDQHKVKIIPYNPKVKAVFNKQRQELHSVLGPGIPVLHKGASAWGISGKGDLDIYIPVSAAEFNNCFKQLKKELGEHGSFYAQERVRWNKVVEGIETEIFLVNQEATFWQESLILWDYLENHPTSLAEYQKLKEDADGLSTREYYRVKLEFYNKIGDLAKSNDSN